MAMVPSAMATLIVNNLKTLNPKITGTVETELLNSWTQICAGMITHITTAAVVNSTGTGTATVTTAPGVAPVTTTDVGTIS